MKDKKPDKKEVHEDEVGEVTTEALEKVSGGENLFDDVPRVPEQPIDPELRGKG